jgi:hypothetical protein
MAYPGNITTNLAAMLAQARGDIPSAHHQPPPNRIVSSPEDSFVHINNWAFMNGQAFVITQGSSALRSVRYDDPLHYCHHHQPMVVLLS